MPDHGLLAEAAREHHAVTVGEGDVGPAAREDDLKPVEHGLGGAQQCGVRVDVILERELGLVR